MKNCDRITIGENLTENQKLGLELVAQLSGSKDVVFAIDLTESVSLDDEGRLRLRQIIQDSLNKGDTVYIVPFSSQINPRNPDVNPLSLSKAIAFNNSPAQIDKIIEQIPLQANLQEKNTDIQQAEHFIYQNLAQINQNRLCNQQKIKSQSVVWLTDAPLNTGVGITSDVWIETPADSPYRNPKSAESSDRHHWLTRLPLDTRSQNIDNYQLSVTDIKPTVQEFCTPAPGGKETCLVNSYLVSQLWLPATILSLLIIILSGSAIWAYLYWRSLQKTWKLEVKYGDDEDTQILYLKNQRSVSIGEDVECRGGEIRGYLRRERNQLILDTNNNLPIIYQGKDVKQRLLIKSDIIRLNCPHDDRDFEITIKVKR